MKNRQKKEQTNRTHENRKNGTMIVVMLQAGLAALINRQD